MHFDRNAKITGAEELDFDAASQLPVAVFRLAQRQQIERPLTIVEGLARSMTIASLTSTRLTEILASPELAAADKAVLGEALARQKELEAALRSLDVARADLAAIEKELARLREDAKALGGDRAAAQQGPLVKRLLDAEDRHALAKKKIDTLVDDTKARAEAVRTNLAKLAS
jgi:hypothetical protein